MTDRLPILALTMWGKDSEDEGYVYAFEADADNDAMSFYIQEYDQDYYYDSGNDDEDENINFIPHALVFGRKHNIIFERVGDEIQFLPYNGDPTDIMQVLVPNKKGTRQLKSTIDVSKYTAIQEWSRQATYQANHGYRLVPKAADPFGTAHNPLTVWNPFFHFICMQEHCSWQTNWKELHAE